MLHMDCATNNFGEFQRSSTMNHFSRDQRPLFPVYGDVKCIMGWFNKTKYASIFTMLAKPSFDYN